MRFAANNVGADIGGGASNEMAAITAVTIAVGIRISEFVVVAFATIFHAIHQSKQPTNPHSSLLRTRKSRA